MANTVIAEESGDDENGKEISGIQPLDERINELEQAIKAVNDTYEMLGKKLSSQINIWIAICVVIILSGIILTICMFSVDVSEKSLVWIIYNSIERLIVISALFSLATFSFRMLKSYLQMQERNNQKRAVIDSLPSLTASGSSGEQRDLVFMKLIEVIISFGEPAINSSINDFSNTPDKLIDLIKSFKDK